MNKEELELLSAEKRKVDAEIKVLNKTTPLTESIKVIGSMILGIGGIIAAFAGYQLAEVKAKNYQLEAKIAKENRDDALLEAKIAQKDKDDALQELNTAQKERDNAQTGS